MMRIYLSIPQRIRVKNKKVKLGDLGQIIVKDQKLLKELMEYQILDLKEEKIKVIDIMQIIETLQKRFGELDVINFGETEFIVQYGNEKSKSKLYEYAKVALISCIVFFGSAFSIMTFNEDASILDVFDKIYMMCTGLDSPHGTLVEVAYSLGLTLGILLFYNHLFRKKKKEDPTPIQIEMREFEKDINETIIINSDREG